MSVAITGNTYPVKDQLKALGARWNPDTKSWLVPDNKAEQARALVSGAPKSAPNRNSVRRGNWDPQKFNGYGAKRGGYTRNEDDECEVCGKNKYRCGHCVGW